MALATGDSIPLSHASCLSPFAQREGLRETEELGFEYRRQRFVYAAEPHMFEKLKYPIKVCMPGSTQAALCHSAKQGAWNTHQI